MNHHTRVTREELANAIEAQYAHIGSLDNRVPAVMQLIDKYTEAKIKEHDNIIKMANTYTFADGTTFYREDTMQAKVLEARLDENDVRYEFSIDASTSPSYREGFDYAIGLVLQSKNRRIAKLQAERSDQ